MASPLAIKARSSRVLACIVAMLGVTIVPGHADVGVTSGTDGDPLGRPPTQSERVLRVGINIQANELITTKADDRAHIVFLDGTSLTVAPNAELVIDKYVYDPNTKTGEIAISVSKGVLRLVGGKISKTVPMVVNTPASTIGIRGGIALIVAEARQTQASFLFGIAMTASANGRTEKATRPGSQIVTKLGEAPGVPTIIAPGALTGQMAALEGRTAKSDRGPDAAAKQSGFSSINSGQPLIVGQIAPNQQPMNKVAVQALTNAGTERQPLSDPAGVVTFVSALPPSVTLPPSPTTPVVVATPGVSPQPVPSPVAPSAAAIPTFAASMLPAIQRPAAAAVAGVGNGSLATPSSSSSSTSIFPSSPKPGTTPAVGGGSGGVVPSTNGPSTPIRTTTSTVKPPTTPTTSPPPLTTGSPLSTRNGATPAVGVGNGGLIKAIPPTHSNGRK